ncbi:hypothetical protein [Novosphingobium sp.]|uniref:hypothetical protein n=1 Tax=Novosphingobium sp. TaxID=1874826 RepID=UPI0035674F49
MTVDNKKPVIRALGRTATESRSNSAPIESRMRGLASDLGAELAARSGTATQPAFSFDLQTHAMTIQGGLRALSSLIAEGKGAPNNDDVVAFASDLAALVGLIADAVQPLCEGNAA